MKKIWGLGLFIYCCNCVVFPITECQQKVNLEYVNFSRIDSAEKKYEQLQNRVKWINRLKYTSIGVGCAVLGFLVLDHWTTKPDKVDGKASKSSEKGQKDTSKIDLERKRIELEIHRLEEKELNKSFKGMVKNKSFQALQFVFYTTVASILATSFWSVINKSGDFFKDNFGGIDPQNPEIYKQKYEELNDLMKRLGFFLLHHGQNTEKELNSKFFDLIFADVLIDHTTLIRWFEDIIGFIKCAIILSTGSESLEVACLQKDIISLSNNLNQFSDNLSLVINSSVESERSKLIEQASDKYLIFCKQFAKFIYDCGLYLYEQNFLHK